MAGIVTVAILEAAIAFAILPWLPKTLHGFDVLAAAGIYMGVFLGSVAFLDYRSRKRARADGLVRNSQKGKWF